MINFNSEKLKQIIQKFGLSLIVLFGSQSRLEASLKSDIDVAVLVEDDASLKMVISNFR